MKNFVPQSMGSSNLHFSPTLTKYLPLSPCILLHCIFYSSPLLMASFACFQGTFLPLCHQTPKSFITTSNKEHQQQKKFTSDRVLYQLNPPYLPLFEQAPPFSKLVALPILTSIVMPICDLQGQCSKEIELMEIALGDQPCLPISLTFGSYGLVIFPCPIFLGQLIPNVGLVAMCIIIKGLSVLPKGLKGCDYNKQHL